jgi:glutamate dehydrogenase
VRDVGEHYFETGARFSLGWLRLAADKIAPSSHWERLAIQSMIADLQDEQRRLTASVIQQGSMEKWLSANALETERYDLFIKDIKSKESPDVARLMVALRHIRALH